MNNYKDGIQLKADELAQERFSCDFYDLTEEQQRVIYGEAEQTYFEGAIENAMNCYEDDVIRLSKIEADKLWRRKK